ncbi:ANK [Seminavis robusta]|uniref:ANK n=1 Tax=Seminavis robusta TaxID=568900 RepID=A0A9N8HD75_9STRA|nr:ANK [Seminavis robusta]|eukprot:Sro412_g137950.1 ANK (483) ;mRNA; f:54387-55835
MDMVALALSGDTAVAGKSTHTSITADDEEEDSSDSEYDEDLTNSNKDNNDEDDSSSSDGSSSSSGSSGGYATTDSESCCSGYMDAISREMEEMNRSRRDSIRQSLRRSSLSALDTLKGMDAPSTGTTNNKREDLKCQNLMQQAQDRSQRFLLHRMSSTKATSYVQDKPSTNANIPQIPPFAGNGATTVVHNSNNDTGNESSNDATIIRRRSTGDLLDESSKQNPQSPQECLQELLRGVSSPVEFLTTEYWDKQYFCAITPARMQRYHAKVARAVRGQDIETLRTIVKGNASPNILDACNSQGESLVHLACRRRNTDLLKFLVHEAGVSVRVRDDWGKSPLHEQCWNGRPSFSKGKLLSNQAEATTGALPTSPYYYYHPTNPESNSYFDAVKLLIDLAPELLFARDRRGFVPFQYIPKDSWPEWNTFLAQHRVWIRCKVQFIGYARSRDKLKKTLELAEATLKGISRSANTSPTGTGPTAMTQ